MTVKPPAPPPLPDELERLLHRLRLPYVRRAAAEVIATATSQRWEHTEVLKVLLSEEAAGRDQATIRTRRRASGLPAGRRSTPGNPIGRSSQRRRSTRCGRWNGSIARRCCASAVQAGRARAISSRRSGTRRSTRAAPSPGTHQRRSRNSCVATASMTASTRRSGSSSASIWWWLMMLASFRSQPTRPRRCSAWSMPPTRNDRSRSRRTSTRPALTS